MNINLWNHQRTLVDFAIARSRCVWASGVGTGKTRASIALATEIGARVVLVATPRAVIDGFAREVATLRPDATVLTTKGKGTCKARENAILGSIQAADGPIFLIGNLESLRMMPGLLSLQWCLFVADEAHRLKSHNGKASKWAAKVKAKKTVGMSGTILGQTPIDAFGTWRALGLGHRWPRTLTAFREKFAVMHPTVRGWILDWKNLDEFERTVGMDTIRIETSDVLDLPELVHTTVPVELSAKEARAHADLREQMVHHGDDGQVIIPDNPLVCVLRLLQACSGWVQWDDTPAERIVDVPAKRSALKEILDDLDEPVVVFYRFQAELEDIRQVCDPMVLNGHQDDLAAWQGGEGKVLAVQIQAGGTGITLVRARVAIYYSQTPSLVDYEQSLARLHRPGQTRSVNLIHLVASLPSSKLSAEELLVRGRTEKGDLLKQILATV